MFKKPKYPKGMRFYPTFIMDDVLIIFFFMALFCAGVFFFPELIFTVDSEIPADPFNTPEHIKPEWYFLASYQFLKIIPSEIGALIIMTLVMLIVILLPFVDRSRETRILKRPVFLFFVIASLGLFIGLTVWGAYS
jgi:ubiquinol-cytochrome c reductase cytochrome b subunit